MHYWLDCDLKGNTSIRRKIDAGLIRHLQCNTFDMFDQFTQKLIGIVTPQDTVVCDTLSMLLDTTRGDAKIGSDPNALIWEKKSKWLEGDKNYLNVYDMAGQLTMRKLKNLSARGAQIIVICHEDEFDDESTIPVTKKRGPQVNPALVNKLIGSSSDVFRLDIVDDPIYNGDGEEVVHKNDRILYLRRTESFVAKFSVDDVRSPSIYNALVQPTIPKLYEHLGERPPFLTLYGPPGVGKTTLAFSDLIVPKTDSAQAGAAAAAS